MSNNCKYCFPFAFTLHFRNKQISNKSHIVSHEKHVTKFNTKNSHHSHEKEIMLYRTNSEHFLYAPLLLFTPIQGIELYGCS